ncbi:MAG: glycosyltransferase [Rhodospirillales bacterium]|nr:glycosyltransferase [Rhodospirillales bacterium]
MNRPRLLFVSPRFLFPTDEGGKIRTSNILRNMKGGAFEVTLASPAPPDVSGFAAEIDAVCDEFLSWPAPTMSRLGRLMALAASVPVGVATDRSARGCEVVAGAIAGQTDVVLVDFPHADVLVPRHIDPASVMFTHNVEAEIFERHAGLARGIWRLVWRSQAQKMRRFEGEVLRRFDTVIAVSARDGEALARRYALPSVHRIDTGVDLDFFNFQPASAGGDGNTIVFVGAMDSPANIDGVAFLMQEIWPLVLRGRPAARAVIVGRRPPESLVSAARDRGLAWEFTGLVDDIRPHVAAADVAVIPLRIGSGTRIKAFEAMAMGRPVVSTRLGVEGLDIEPGEHFLAADPAADFAAAILRLLGDAALGERLARQARTRLEARFSWAQVARQFEAICLAARRGQSRG